MTFENHEGIVRFINASREQRRWLSRELSNLDARSENYESYESYQPAIRGAIGEPDTVTWKAMRQQAWLICAEPPSHRTLFRQESRRALSPLAASQLNRLMNVLADGVLTM
jgi:hypothetical protein